VRPARLAPAIAALLVCFVFVSPGSAAPAPGSLDPSFNGDGIAVVGLASGPGSSERFFGIGVQNSRVFATGEANERLTLVKFLPGGGIDPSFGGGNGIVRIDFGHRTYGEGVAFFPDGRIVVVGGADDAHAHSRLAIVVFRAGGRLDRRFSGDGRLALRPPEGLDEWFGYDAIVQPDGKILAIGESYSSAGAQPGNFDVARIKPNGSLDKTFSGDGMASVNFLPGDDGAWEGQLTSDGKLVLAGWVFDKSTNSWDTGLARLTRKGKLDPGFSGDGKLVLDLYKDQNDYAYGLALRSTGAIVVGSHTYPSGGSGVVQPRVAQVAKNGTLDKGFSGDGKAIGFAPGSYFDDLAIDGSGRILGVGTEVGTGNMMSFRLTKTGAPDGHYGTNGVMSAGVNGSLYEMMLDGQDRPVSVGGYGQDSAAFRLAA
jgi:uncharacterized delta-60 repeat protein